MKEIYMKKIFNLIISLILINFALIFSMYQEPINYKKILKDETRINTRDVFGRTILINAAKDNEIEIVTILLEKKADLNKRDVFGFTALMRASERGNKEIVKLLIDAKANLDIKATNISCALSRAANEDHKDIVQILINAGAIPNILTRRSLPDFLYEKKKDSHDISNLILFGKLAQAIKNNQKDNLKILLVKYPDLIDNNGNNALHLTNKVENQYTAARIFQFILNFVPKLYNKKNKSGKTAMDENPQIIFYLIKQNLLNPELITKCSWLCNLI